jgi:hypothetical protein
VIWNGAVAFTDAIEVNVYYIVKFGTEACSYEGATLRYMWSISEERKIFSCFGLGHAGNTIK